MFPKKLFTCLPDHAPLLVLFLLCQTKIYEEHMPYFKFSHLSFYRSLHIPFGILHVTRTRTVLSILRRKISQPLLVWLAHRCHPKDQCLLEPCSLSSWCLVLYLCVQEREDHVGSVCTSDFPITLVFRYHFASLKMQEIFSLVDHLLKSQLFTI